ncbi:uncharacterized protein LOC143956661 [Lithobates pipiens]
MLISCAVLFVIICLSGCHCNYSNQSYLETAPVLTLLPSHLWYLMGESVTINCSVPNKSKKQCFKFFKDYISISTQTSSTFNIQSLENSDGGLYSCETLQNNSSSTRSNKRQIHVYAQPPPPIVSLEPSQVMYMAGQPVGMTCFTFRDHEEKILRFYKNGQKIFSLESCTGNATLHIDTSLPGSGGNYSCDYKTKRLGTWISSITRTVFVNISADQTKSGTTISTSVLLTKEFPRNGIVTSEAQETHISTGTATNAVSMASVSSTSNQDENAVAETSPAIHFSTGISINSVSIASVSSTSKQHENTDAKTISSETHSSTASALLTSQDSMVSQWTNQTNVITTSDHSTTWIFYVIGGCILFILLCVLLVVLMLRGYFSRTGNKAKPVNAPLWANNDISHTKKSKRTYKETEIDMSAPMYSELDQSPPLMKLSSAPSASLGSLAHFKPSAVPVYSTVQAVSPLPCVYSTLLPQKPFQKSCPTLLQPENASSSVN